eukprot:CAMPEP_0194311856 /NCGR_PEP_ID=MMETSP0171-20130528/8780_1 /TAXON_ID=218684 /ORGANISM="Corethron pennatum, Strain L29A3" /LENGTH=447 /DNA_ID=CAMNT_0039066113 /DNA_START=15 /DNA_END=1358 /DNA_ORIENTATION=-
MAFPATILVITLSAITAADTAHPEGENIRKLKKSKITKEHKKSTSKNPKSKKVKRGDDSSRNGPSADNDWFIAPKPYYDVWIGQDQDNSISSFSNGPSNVCLDDAMKDWHLKFTKVLDAWDYSQQEGKPSKGDGIVIAQVDSGYSDHNCFDGIFADENNKGLNYYFQNNWPTKKSFNDPRDKSFPPPGAARHGTTVASAALNRGVNGGPPGTAPKASLFSIRVTNYPVLQYFDIQRMIRVFDDIADPNWSHNIHVVSMSLGIPNSIPLRPDLENSVKRAIKEKNLIVVAAAGQIGNFGSGDGAMNPARFEDVLAVGGVDRDYNWFGNKGSEEGKVHIAGPALDVCNARSNGLSRDPNLYGPSMGTSITTAMTAGIAALWLAHHGRDYLIEEFSSIGKNLNEAFMKVVEKTAHKPYDGWPRDQGYGIIDAVSILQMDVSNIKKILLED